MVYLEKPEPERARRRARKRRWILAPIVAWEAKGIEGLEILKEIDAPQSAAVFMFYRAVRLWAVTDPEARTDLFVESIPGWLLSALEQLDSEVTPPSITELFTRLLSESKSLHRDEVANSVSSLANWAFNKNYIETEVTFAILACIVAPRNPHYAFEAGRATRRAGRYELSEECFRRSVGLARRTNDSEAYASAFIGWGLLEQQRGRLTEADARFQRAWRAAEREKLDLLAGAARYYLLSLAAKAGKFDEAMQHATAAYTRFSRRETGKEDWLVALASNTGSLLSEFGYFSAALVLYETALPRLPRLEDRCAVLCSIGRAAAAVADRVRFDAVWMEVTGTTWGRGELLVESFVELARGAITLNAYRKAHALLVDAIEAATDPRNPAVVEAHVLLDQIANSDPPKDEDRPLPPRVNRFVKRFLERLRQ